MSVVSDTPRLDFCFRFNQFNKGSNYLFCLQHVYDNEISREVLRQSKAAINKLSKVVPRGDILDKVKAYVLGKSDRPLVVHGHSGCGKTSVMASVAVEVMFNNILLVILLNTP